MKSLRCSIITCSVVLAVSAPTFAEPGTWDDLMRGGELVVDQQPTQGGGTASDTALRDDFGHETWQQTADDVMLAESALIGHIVWWGFYHLDNPPASETMRIRFYDARPGDGLPGNVLFEESFLDPLRTATGLIVFTGVDPHEYIYEVDLTTPFQLALDTPFWLEIVQIGDLDTGFRWEYAGISVGGLAIQTPYTAGWRYTSYDTDDAFQLWTVPEPGSLVLLALGLGMAGVTRSRKEDGWRFP